MIHSSNKKAQLSPEKKRVTSHTVLVAILTDLQGHRLGFFTRDSRCYSMS